LNRRFQIEGSVAQDGQGVVLEALDTQTKQRVQVRKCFPHGSAGAGFSAKHQKAYEEILPKLEQARHRNLRAVVAGGCDSDDAKPFLVSEPVTGSTLEDLLATGPLSAGDAVLLLEQALEVSAMLSEVLEIQSVWVETDPSAVGVDESGDGRRFRFWVSPANGLSEADAQTALAPLLTLLQEATAGMPRNGDARLTSAVLGWQEWAGANAAATPAQARRELNDRLLAASPAASLTGAPKPILQIAPAALAQTAPVAVKTPSASAPARAIPPAPPTRALAAMPSSAAAVPTKPAALLNSAPAASSSPVNVPSKAAKKSGSIPLWLTILILALCLGAIGFQVWRWNSARVAAEKATEEKNSSQSEQQQLIEQAIQRENNAFGRSIGPAPEPEK
jgi:hypothetical protein